MPPTAVLSVFGFSPGSFFPEKNRGVAWFKSSSLLLLLRSLLFKDAGDTPRNCFVIFETSYHSKSIL
jgi:hypothetical protein